ncbi:MAG: hypothetical protein ACRDCE_18080 [Cetobacterium sp.]|uniref:hypothetical protein n=1 Tax=Cetobacterium sp. TaxID=2071632 RepID=UPI003EE5922D
MNTGTYTAGDELLETLKDVLDKKYNELGDRGYNLGHLNSVVVEKVKSSYKTTLNFEEPLTGETLQLIGHCSVLDSTIPAYALATASSIFYHFNYFR